MILKRNFSMLKNDSRVLKEAECLLENGYQVYILIYRGSKEDDIKEYNGINIISTPIQDISFFGRYNKFKYNENYNGKHNNFFSKCLNRILNVVYDYKYYEVSLQEAKKLNADIYHCNDFETLKIGYKLKIKLNKKIVYDSHELWMESKTFSKKTNVIKRSINGLRKIIQKKQENKYIKYNDVNITVNNSIAEYLSNVYKMQKPKIIKNVPKKIEFNSGHNGLLRKEIGIEKSKKIVLYQGVLSNGRGLLNLIKAWEYIDKNIILVLMGYGDLYNEIKSIIKNTKYTKRIILKDAVAPNILLQYTRDADLGIAPIQNICLSYYYSSPNKVWEYMLAGVPFLASNFPELNKLTIDLKMGLPIDPESPKDIAEKVNFILNEKNKDLYLSMKKNCIHNANAIYNWDCEKEKFINIYKHLSE